MIINHKSGKGGVVGKDGTTPHIGANGNWFLGETDTGVAAQGKSDTCIETIMLPVADWDSETLSQTITCSGVLEDETKQIITTVAFPGNEEICETCHVICSAFAKDSLTFTVTVMPETDIYLYVILENVSGGSNATNNVYSTEETVVGRWIDGKPIYRKSFKVISISGFTDLTDVGVYEDLVTSHGYWLYAARKLMLPYYGNNSAFYAEISDANKLRLYSDGICANREVVLTLEYTKTTDNATIDIPSATSMMNAYEEGVNEA